MTPSVVQRTPTRLSRALRRRVSSLMSVWAPIGYPLPTPDQLRAVVSQRFTSRLGSADPHARVVTLRGDVDGWPAAQLRHVLTHELAHLAVHARHGQTVAPHGAEWSALMRVAKVPSGARITARCRARSTEPVSAAALSTDAPVRRRSRYEHRCPVCQMTRIAKRPVSRWRCRACSAVGLEGRLSIVVLPNK